MVAWRRLAAMYAAAFTVFVALLAVSVRPLGYSPWVNTYAMLYNRDGWLLYSTLLLLVRLRRSRIEAGGSRSGRMALGGVAAEEKPRYAHPGYQDHGPDRDHGTFTARDGWVPDPTGR